MRLFRRIYKGIFCPAFIRIVKNDYIYEWRSGKGNTMIEISKQVGPFNYMSLYPHQIPVICKNKNRIDLFEVAETIKQDILKRERINESKKY